MSTLDYLAYREGDRVERLHGGRVYANGPEKGALLPIGTRGTVVGQPYYRAPGCVFVRWDGQRQEDMAALEMAHLIRRLSLLELMAEVASDQE